MAQGTDYDVVQSLKFYFMLSIYLKAHEVSEELATKSMKEFVKDGAEWHRDDSKIISHYYEQAYLELPSGFLSLMEISSPGDSDQITFKSVG